MFDNNEMMPGETLPSSTPEAPAEPIVSETTDEDYPEYRGPFDTPEKQEPEESKESDFQNKYSDILKYGLDAAAAEVGVEATVQAIYNFHWNGIDDPITQLLRDDLGFDTNKEVKDYKEEERARRAELNDYLTSENGPTTLNKSIEGALQAIKDFQELITEVNTQGKYAKLREKALSAGKGIYEYAVYKYPVRGLTVLLKELKNQTEEEINTQLEKEEMEEKEEEEDQTGNQSSTENSSPETEAA